MRIGRSAAVLAAGVVLAGCASVPAPDAAVLGGRIAVRVDSQPPRSLAAAFELRGDARAGSLRLVGPLGTTAADARWAPGEALLTTAEGSRAYAGTDELTAATLGERIPLAALIDWLRGRPWPQAPSAPAVDPVGFEQLGWRIDLSRHDQGWIEAVRDTPPRVTVRAIVEPPG